MFSSLALFVFTGSLTKKRSLPSFSLWIFHIILSAYFTQFKNSPNKRLSANNITFKEGRGVGECD